MSQLKKKRKTIIRGVENMELKKEQLKNISGGAVTSAMINAINKAVNTIYELGRQTGSALKRLIKNKQCAIR
jgi:hypothetical protein